MSKSPSLRRIQADIRELAVDPSDRYHAAPLENDMFEWHFTIRGAPDTDFDGGIYHGRILLPPDYPFKPPHIIFLTHTGRFEINTKVCLSFSAYHPELWQPAWGIRLILEALISFLPTPADGAIGALDWSSTERKKLAIKSQNFCCPTCGPIQNLIPKKTSTTGSNRSSSSTSLQFSKQIEELQRWQIMSHPKESNETKLESTKITDSAVTSSVEIQGNDALTTEDTKQTKEPSSSNEQTLRTTNDGNVTLSCLEGCTTASVLQSNCTSEKKSNVKSTPTLAADESYQAKDENTAPTISNVMNNETKEPSEIIPRYDDVVQEPINQAPPPRQGIIVVNNNNNNNDVAIKFLDCFLQIVIVGLSIVCAYQIHRIQELTEAILSIES